MNFLVIVAATLAALFVWALIAPRLLWRTVIGWSYRDAYSDEPSAVVFGLYRLAAVIGIVALVATGIVVNQSRPEGAAAQAPPHSAVEKMWAVPAPVVLNRVATALHDAPTGLVDQPILAYQPVDGMRRQPSYLFSLKHFQQDAAVDANGLIGVTPSPGLVALDSADLVVQVKGDHRCFAQQVVVRERDDTIEVGVFYGQPNPFDGSKLTHVRDCELEPNGSAAVSVLIPLALSDAVGTRSVVRLDGTAVKRVTVLRD